MIPGAVKGFRGTACCGITLKEVIPTTTRRQIVLGKTSGEQKQGCSESQSQRRHGRDGGKGANENVYNMPL